jgi:hypothetical protein
MRDNEISKLSLVSRPPVMGSTAMLTVQPSHARQTAQPTTPFREFLQTSANVVLSSAQAATAVAGMPYLSAAMSRVRFGPQSSGAMLGQSMLGLETTAPVVDDSTTELPPEFGAMASQRYADDLRLLRMQDQIQAYNRQVTMLSNVIKARHETNKAAINNLRS